MIPNPIELTSIVASTNLIAGEREVRLMSVRGLCCRHGDAVKKNRRFCKRREGAGAHRLPGKGQERLGERACFCRSATGPEKTCSGGKSESRTWPRGWEMISYFTRG
jgi:hypothetical protein